MKMALVAHLNGEPLTPRTIGDICRLIQGVQDGWPRPSRVQPKVVGTVAVARDVILLFQVEQKDAVKAAFNDADPDRLESRIKQYQRILPKLARSDAPVSASFDEVIEALKRTDHFKRHPSLLRDLLRDLSAQQSDRRHQ